MSSSSHANHIITDLVVLGFGDRGVTVVPMVSIERFVSLQDLCVFLQERLGVEVTVVHPGALGLGEDVPSLPVVFEVIDGALSG